MVTAIHRSREKIRGFCRTVHILGADYGLLKILSRVRITILCTIYVVNSKESKAVDNPRIMHKIGSVIFGLRSSWFYELFICIQPKSTVIFIKFYV